MSDLTRSIDIVFAARNEISPVVGQIEASLNQFDTAVQNVAQPLARVADQLLKTEAALLALAAAFTGAAIDAAGRFGDAVNESLPCSLAPPSRSAALVPVSRITRLPRRNPSPRSTARSTKPSPRASNMRTIFPS
jgi:ABC-type transporter Mla subunit MlaD